MTNRTKIEEIDVTKIRGKYQISNGDLMISAGDDTTVSLKIIALATNQLIQAHNKEVETVTVAQIKPAKLIEWNNEVEECPGCKENSPIGHTCHPKSEDKTIIGKLPKKYVTGNEEDGDELIDVQITIGTWKTPTITPPQDTTRWIARCPKCKEEIGSAPHECKDTTESLVEECVGIVSKCHEGGVYSGSYAAPREAFSKVLLKARESERNKVVNEAIIEIGTPDTIMESDIHAGVTDERERVIKILNSLKK